MKILELKDKRAQLLTENRSALADAKKEVRKLSEAEQRAFEANVQSIKDLDQKISDAEAELRDGKGTKKVEPEKKIEMKEKRFSLLEAIRNRAENRAQPDHINAVIDAGKKEFRHSGQNIEGDIILPMEYRANIVAGTDTAGKEIVSTEKFEILKPLRESLVLMKAGAQFIDNCIGDISIPAYGGTSAAWKGEVVSADDGAGAFSDVDMKPKRLTAYIDISKQFLAQDSVGAEAMLKEDIVLAIAAKLEGTVLGKANVSATQPLGMFYTAPTVNGAASWANVVALETALDSSNALIDNLSYVTNAGARGILKTTEKAPGTAKFLLDGKEMNGYPVHVTNHVAKELQTGADEYGIAFANWRDLVIASWGGIDIVVDPFTVAKEGKVRLVVNAYFDAAWRRTASYKTGSLK